MKEVRKVIHKGKEILIIEYAGSKPDRMIEILAEAKRLMQTDKKCVLVLSIFGKNYITPAFMRHLEKEVLKIENSIEKNAVMGLTEVQKWLLKGINTWYKRPLCHFDSYDEAMNFLVE